MNDATDYDPVECPVSDCSYSDAIRSVAAHVGRSDDDGHSWDRLAYGGARDFVETEKRRQRQAGGGPTGRGASTGQGTATGDGGSATTEASSSTGKETATTDGRNRRTSTEADDWPDEQETPFELGFERDALVLLHLAREYDLSSLEDLGTAQLADLYSLLADLKNSAEDARKEVRDALLDDLRSDCEVTAELGSVERRTYRYRQLEDEATVRRALDAAGVDPESVRSFDKSKLRDAVEETGLDERTVFDVEERHQIRIAGADDDSRRRRFDRLDPEIRSLAEDEQ